jgi:hypothetical protein
MKTLAEREKDFRKDLDELLNKHKAEIYVADDGKPYGMATHFIEVAFDGIYKDCETLAEYGDFKL